MTTSFEHGYALLVGVGGDDISVTVDDAAALYDVLIDVNRAGYPPKQVQLLTKEKATRQGILDGLDQIIQQVNVDDKATAMVYYSGHGGRIKQGQQDPSYYLVPHGFDSARLSDTAITGTEFTQKIQALNAKKLVVFLDCCHAGGIPIAKEAPMTFAKSAIPSELDEVLNQGTGRVIVASSHDDELSYTGAKLSDFTRCLLEALEGKGAARRDGVAHILNVLDYLFIEVKKSTQGRQNPYVNEIRDLGDNFPLCHYAGGPEQAPGVLAASSSLVPSMSMAKRSVLEVRRVAFQLELEVRGKKIMEMRKAFGREAGKAVHFQLSQEILDEELELDKLAVQIGEIEAQLNA